MAKDTHMLGIGGAPTRATTLPEGAEERKKFPVASGVLDYFPDALVAISNISQRGNDQHNPGKPLNWNRSKSADESDTMIRHFLQRGTLDTDGTRHSAKLAWRALALLQKEIEAEQAEEKLDSESMQKALDALRGPRSGMGRLNAKENPEPIQKALDEVTKWAAEKEVFLETCKARVEQPDPTDVGISRIGADELRSGDGRTNPCGCAPAFVPKHPMGTCRLSYGVHEQNESCKAFTPTCKADVPQTVPEPVLGMCDSNGGRYLHPKDDMVKRFNGAPCKNWKPCFFEGRLGKGK